MIVKWIKRAQVSYVAFCGLAGYSCYCIEWLRHITRENNGMKICLTYVTNRRPLGQLLIIYHHMYAWRKGPFQKIVNTLLDNYSSGLSHDLIHVCCKKCIIMIYLENINLILAFIINIISQPIEHLNISSAFIVRLIRECTWYFLRQ